eukprot:g48486.t1
MLGAAQGFRIVTVWDVGYSRTNRSSATSHCKSGQNSSSPFPSYCTYCEGLIMAVAHDFSACVGTLQEAEDRNISMRTRWCIEMASNWKIGVILTDRTDSSPLRGQNIGA